MRTSDSTELASKATGFLKSGDTDFDQALSYARQLYVAGEFFLSRRLEQRARELALAMAQAMLASPEIDPAAGKSLARALKGLSEHPHARRLLARLYESNKADVRAAQQLALSTYKDEEFPADERFIRALEILEAIGLRDPNCRDPETLGLGGAIYKRQWERNGQLEDLHTALYFYRKGWTVSPCDDMGYCAINAAYILDLLAHRVSVTVPEEGKQAEQAVMLMSQAKALREAVMDQIPAFAREGKQPSAGQPNAPWWYLVTMAEAAFGLKAWDEAGEWLGKARHVEHFEWERETTAKQLVSIARIRGFLPPPQDATPECWEPPWRALYVLLQDDAKAAFDSHRGKVGLALSGGGFRASLFHLGVLARLAECDALRGVEALSTVSGGSILGAHYYLALQKKLQQETDSNLTRDAYISVVREVIDQFRAGVQQNLRMRVISNLWANLKMLFSRSYGRSNRMGELYERFLYARFRDKDAAGTNHSMDDLLIKPLMPRTAGAAAAETDEDFKPKFSNWRRRAKVPVLLINATSLNSGHNWHFTSSWMGEPPGLIGQEVDMNERYRRLYYRQAPQVSQRGYPLGYAVASSAGVPGLFDPLVLQDLYPDRTVRLVDGGVHDNQGIAGLMDEGCTLVLCSDASGQMGDEHSPTAGMLGVLLRSKSILEDRLRETQYQDLAARVRSHALRGLFFVHLKQELESDPVDWIGCQDRGTPARRGRCTSYGVDRIIQKLLAKMRTDLDTFTDVEAYALMASGYLMTKTQLVRLDDEFKKSGQPGGLGGFDVRAPSRGDWSFSPLLPVLAADPETDPKAADVVRQLKVSGKLFGKVWLLVTPLLALGIVLGVAVAVAAAFWILTNWDRSWSFTLRTSGVMMWALVFLIGLLLPFGRYLRPVEAFRQWLFRFLVALVAWVFSNIHILVFDRIFKARGSLQRLMRL